MSAVMEIPDILKTLPHRFPMLLVDRVVELDKPNNRIVGIKNLTFNEPFFQGHFPENPVMPGVLQLEAMAQVGGILMNQILHRHGEIAYFLAVDNAKFRRRLVPGDCMRIEVEMVRVRLGMARVRGRVLCEGEMACEADLMFGFAKE